jgi:methanogenic corrinoid protein MtbC1
MLVREPRIQPPQLESYSDMPLFNTKAVVHQTGAPAPTLRAWERRYGILAPRRGENDYRLYSERDMAIITWLRERVESGLTISQAIALLRSLEPARRRGRRGRAGGGSLADPHEAHETHEAHEHSAPPLTASKLSLNDISMTLLDQFINLDEASASRTIAQAFAIYSIEDICLSLFAPALARLGKMWGDGDANVTMEHFASALIRERLESLFRSAFTGDGGPLALVGCAPGELHELGALTLALFLRRAGLRVIYLGQSIELESLITTIETVRPACLLLSAALHPQAETLIEVGRRLAALGQRQPVFYFGGQAFSAEPDLVERIQGAYLELDAPAAAQAIKRRLTA